MSAKKKTQPKTVIRKLSKQSYEINHEGVWGIVIVQNGNFEFSPALRPYESELIKFVREKIANGSE